MSADEYRSLNSCKCQTSAATLSVFIFFQLWWCFITCDCLSRLNWVEIGWWSESFFKLEFTQQLTTCCSRSAVLNMRSTVIDCFLASHVIVSDRVRSQKSVSLTMQSSSSVMSCLMKHQNLSQIEWWRLKSFNMMCSFNLLSSYDSLKINDSRLTWV